VHCDAVVRFSILVTWLPAGVGEWLPGAVPLLFAIVAVLRDVFGDIIRRDTAAVVFHSPIH
jgi:hypothetical protein